MAQVYNNVTRGRHYQHYHRKQGQARVLQSNFIDTPLQKVNNSRLDATSIRLLLLIIVLYDPGDKANTDIFCCNLTYSLQSRSSKFMIIGNCQKLFTSKVKCHLISSPTLLDVDSL